MNNPCPYPHKIQILLFCLSTINKICNSSQLLWNGIWISPNLSIWNSGRLEVSSRWVLPRLVLDCRKQVKSFPFFVNGLVSRKFKSGRHVNSVTVPIRDVREASQWHPVNHIGRAIRKKLSKSNLGSPCLVHQVPIH